MWLRPPSNKNFEPVSTSQQKRIRALDGPGSKFHDGNNKHQEERTPRAGYCMSTLGHWAGLGAPRIGGGSSVSVNLRGKFNGVSRRRFTGPGQSHDNAANGRRRTRPRDMSSSGKCIRGLVINIMPGHCQDSTVQPMMAAKDPTMAPTAGTSSVQDLGAGQWGILGLARQSSNTGNMSSVRGRLID